jgi:hypothetical protein
MFITGDLGESRDVVASQSCGSVLNLIFWTEGGLICISYCCLASSPFDLKENAMPIADVGVLGKFEVMVTFRKCVFV